MGSDQTFVRNHRSRGLAARLNGEMSQWAERDGDVYWYFLHGKVDELRRLTWEIDEDYASDDV